MERSREEFAKSNVGQIPYRAREQVAYSFYVNLLGRPMGDGTFDSAAEMLPYLKELGITLLYPLPFLESPGLDGGFDVSSYTRIAPSLGGQKSFRHFMGEATRLGMKTRMDLVFNHVSDQHPWFQKFLDGDPKYEDFFVVSKNEPKIISRNNDRVIYEEIDVTGTKKQVERRIIFSDINDSHYRKVKIRNPDKTEREVWVYHTFFPFQVDLNFKNPKVFLELLKVVDFWVREGIDMFRLDAIPFLYKDQESDPLIYTIVEFMRLHLAQVAPGVQLKVEACQPLDKIIRYLGKDKSFGSLTSTDSAQVADDFEGMDYTWLAVLTGEKRYFEEYFKRLTELAFPQQGTLEIFSRAHDELTLEMLPDDLRQIMRQELLEKQKGYSFRKGNGVAGRQADFLDRDIKKMTLMYSILFSRDGMPAIFTGDEIALSADPTLVDAQQKKLITLFDESGTPLSSAESARDERFAGRNSVEKNAFDNMHPLFQAIKNMIQVRRETVDLHAGEMRVVANDATSVLSYSRGSKVLVVHNLKNEAIDVAFDRKLNGNEILDLLSHTRHTIYERDDKFMLRLEPLQTLWLLLP